MADDVRVVLPPPSSAPQKRQPRATRPSSATSFRGAAAPRPRLPVAPPPEGDDDDVPFEDPRHTWARRWLVLHTAALVGLALAGALYAIAHGHAPSGAPPPPPVRVTPVLESDTSGGAVVEGRVAPHHVSFTLVPAPDSAGKWMKLAAQPELRFERLLHYDVCCFVQAFFVCRSATKNLAVEAYVSETQEVVVHVVHPDMVGARCRFTWVERE